MTLSSAYLLVVHGSRDCQAISAASDLEQLLFLKFQSNNILTQRKYIGTDLSFSESRFIPASNFPARPMVETAALELSSLSLKESLISFAQTAWQKGYRSIRILPLFLAPGVHVQKDIPREITLAIKRINNDQLTIELSQYLGKYSGIVPLLSREFSQLSGEARILVSHGSYLPEVNYFSQKMAGQLGAEVAYWSRTPSLKQQIALQVAAGKSRIAIQPYFLFPGKITKAIAKEVERLQEENPELELIMGQSLGATEALAQVIFEEISRL